MILSQEQLRAQAEQEAQAFADLIAGEEEGPSGIRPAPQISISEVVLDASVFELGLDAIPSTAESLGGGGGGGPGPPPDERWACCTGLTGCVDNKTLFECTGLGGTLMIGQHCSDSLCTVPGAGLACDVVEATRYKCGYDGFFGLFTSNGMPVKYKTSTQVWNYVQACPSGCASGPSSCTFSDNHVINGHHAVGTADACTTDPTYTCSGQRIKNGSICNDWSDCSGTGPGCGGCWACGPDSNDGGPCDSDTHCPNFRCVISSADSTCGCTGSGTIDDYYSDEYTDDQLIADTEAALPAFSGIYGACPSSLRDLNPAFPSPVFFAGYHIRRMNYRVQCPAQPISFTAYWNETGPDGVNNMVEVIPAGATEGTVHYLPEPSVNGQTTLTDFSTSVP